ncbi:hypothetical protein FNL53_03760 [Tardiphaga sp. vice278]|nr:hypothetical protein FNL53_03760 [Tardiphaga sp. vice278]
MNPADSFKKLVQFRVPESFSDAIDSAAHKQLQSKSEYLRRCVIDRLEADGVDPRALGGAI